MKCPNCGAEYNAPFRFCSCCGTPLEFDRKGTHRVPLLILLGLSLLGLILFFAVPIQSSGTPWFTVRNGALTFHESRYQGSPEVEIPAVVNGQTVTAIDETAFWECTGVTTVILPDTVTTISPRAFSDCYSLRALDIPDSVTTIGSSAFFSCTELEAIHIPAGVEEIGQTAFMGCDSLAFIFFDGTAEEWEALYPWSIESHPMICTPDGNSFRSE